jgi:FkbM family methyltransferase
LNQIKNITVFPVALGDADAELEYHEPAGTNMATGSFARAPYNFSGKVARLPVRNGDTFIAQNAKRPMTLLKLDVEGYEAPVIRGLETTLREDRPVILMEMSEETRKSFGSEAAFRKQLYEDHAVFEVAARSISGSYRLKPFSFQSTGELCVIPAENSEVLRQLSADPAS